MISNANVAELLRRYAGILSLEGADRFKLKAYRRAAETIESLDADVTELVQKGSDLTELPGIGKAISQVVLEIVQTGKLGRLEHKVAGLAPGLAELADRPALDPKKVMRIYKKLGISSLEELKKSLEEGAIGKLFGARTEFHIRQGMDERPRHLLYSVEDLVKQIESFLQAIPGVTKVSPAGSVRRKQDTIGDLNFLVASRSAAPLFKRFSVFGAALSSEAKSETECAYKLSSGVRVVLRWTASEEWGLAVILATGSAAHVDEIQTRGGRNQIRLTTRGLSAKGVDLTKEESVYANLGLTFIEPELREGRGEVAAAAEGTLPKLIEIGDIRGDLHMHTTASDGGETIAGMATAAKARGYEYIAITDHSQSLKIANGLTEARLLQHIRDIDRVNARLKGLHILKSAEVDILEDGSLDYSRSVLKELDFTICSIHSRFALNKDRQTERILRAMDNRYFNVLGHATGRLLLKRQGYELDMERIIKHAKETGCLFEINSSPDRLDLSEVHARQAKDHGIKIAINTDAHSLSDLDFMSAGINQARRAWLRASDVINTLPLKAMLACLRR